MKPKLKIAIVDDIYIPVFGPGPYLLLLNLEKEKSINKASKKLEISYSKAMKMIHTLEKKIKQPILEKTIGGKQGGGAKLTVFGKKLLDAYKKYTDKINTVAQKEYDKTLVSFFTS